MYALSSGMLLVTICVLITFLCEYRYSHDFSMMKHTCILLAMHWTHIYVYYWQVTGVKICTSHIMYKQIFIIISMIDCAQGLDTYSPSAARLGDACICSKLKVDLRVVILKRDCTCTLLCPWPAYTNLAMDVYCPNNNYIICMYSSKHSIMLWVVYMHMYMKFEIQILKSLWWFPPLNVYIALPHFWIFTIFGHTSNVYILDSYCCVFSWMILIL